MRSHRKRYEEVRKPLHLASSGGIRQTPVAELSDEELLAAYRSGNTYDDEFVVNELFGRYYQRVAHWCLRFTGNREAAADLAQDVFLKAHRHLDSFRGTSRFSTWLYSIARNESINRLERAEPPMQDEEVLAGIAALEAGPDEVVERGERGQRVHGFLSATLDETERRVFTLHYGDDMPLDAITRLLRLDNASGAKAFIVSAKRKLAKAARRLRARGEML